MWYYGLKLAEVKQVIYCYIPFIGGDDKVNLIGSDYVIELLALGNAWNLSPLVAFFLYQIFQLFQRLYDLADIDKMSNFEKILNVTFPPLRFIIFVFICITIVMSLPHDLHYFKPRRSRRVSSTLTYEHTNLALKICN